MKMERHCRKNNISGIDKRLEMKINQHKMLMNTLHEILRKGNVDDRTIALIKAEINDTLKEIEELRNEDKTAGSVSIFDSISKPGECCSSSCTCGCHTTKTNGFYDDVVKLSKTAEFPVIIRNVTPHKPTIDDAIWCNRFLVDLSDMLIPEHMVKAINFIDDSRNKLEVVIYDFMINDGSSRTPVVEMVERFKNRRFTMTISHLDPTGIILYRENYVGCLVSDLMRSQLNYEDSNPSTISILINYDDVSYEAAS